MFWLTIYVFEQTLIVKVYDSILMAIFYVNRRSDPNRKVLDDWNGPINTRSITDGMLRVDSRKRPTYDLYLSLYRTIADDMFRVDFEEANCV